MERLYPQDIDMHTLSPLALAFVGDGVYSLMVRERLLSQANRPVNDLHKLAVKAVRAEAQSAAMERLLPLLTQLPPIRRFEAEAPVLPTVEDLKDHSVQVTNRDGVYFVEANWLFRVMRGIRFDDPDGLLYFERLLDGSGVIDALRAAGCGEGDTVSIYDFEFDFID